MSIAPPPARRRAPAMSPEERREEIIAATIPLLRKDGTTFTTLQIARAAGIAEGTIFRVFNDKRELLQAAVAAAMSTDAEVERIRSIPLDLPLQQRLLAALEAIGDYQERLWALMRRLHESGWRPELDEASHERAHVHPRQQIRRIVEAVAKLIEPDAPKLRIEPTMAARLVVIQAFSCRLEKQGIGEPLATPEQLVDLFLNGALK